MRAAFNRKSLEEGRYRVLLNSTEANVRASVRIYMYMHIYLDAERGGPVARECARRARDR